MRCPKCGYTSFDYNDNCPKCNKDLVQTRELLGLLAVEPQPTPYLAALLAETIEAEEVGREAAEHLGEYERDEDALESDIDLGDEIDLGDDAEEVKLSDDELDGSEGDGDRGEIEFEPEGLDLDFDMDEEPAEEAVEQVEELDIEMGSDEMELNLDEVDEAEEEGEDVLELTLEPDSEVDLQGAEDDDVELTIADVEPDGGPSPQDFIETLVLEPKEGAAAEALDLEENGKGDLSDDTLELSDDDLVFDAGLEESAGSDNDEIDLEGDLLLEGEEATDVTLDADIDEDIDEITIADVAEEAPQRGRRELDPNETVIIDQPLDLMRGYEDSEEDSGLNLEGLELEIESELNDDSSVSETESDIDLEISDLDLEIEDEDVELDSLTLDDGLEPEKPKKR